MTMRPCEDCVYERVCDDLWEIYNDAISWICCCCDCNPDPTKDCTETKCPLNAFTNCEILHPRDISNAMKLFCLECQGGEPNNVAKCDADQCPLHPFRIDPLFDGLCPGKLGLLCDVCSSCRAEMEQNGGEC